MIQDLINAAFELAGVIAALANFRQLMIDRQLRGVNILSCAFFTTWGAWNLYYYGHLNQPASQLASFGLVMANGAWLVLFIKIKSLENGRGNRHGNTSQEGAADRADQSDHRARASQSTGKTGAR